MPTLPPSPIAIPFSGAGDEEEELVSSLMPSISRIISLRCPLANAMKPGQPPGALISIRSLGLKGLSKRIILATCSFF